LGHQDQSRLVQLRKKRDESFLTQAEKIEMFMLDELDQKGDYLIGKYYKDPNSLTDAEAQQLRYSLTRYYQQVEGMSGKEAAKQSINDLLTGNWGYRAHNYDYPYLGYKEQKIEWMDNYFEDKSIFDRILGGRPQSEDEKYFQGEYAWQQYLKATEWEREVGRPVMNFLPGGIGFIYNSIDTLQGSYALGEGIGQIYRDGKFTTDTVLKLTDGVLTFTPVVVSKSIHKGNSTGIINDDILSNYPQMGLAPEPNAIGNINSGKMGSMTIEKGASLNADELKAGIGFLGLGYDVIAKKEVNLNHVKTPDFYVEGIGKVDVYTPEILRTKTILNMIEKKNNQTNSIIIQADLPKSQITEIVNRTWGKPSTNNINTLFFQNSIGRIYRYDRPNKGGK